MHYIGTIEIYELITRKSQITTEKCIWKRKFDFKKSLRWPQLKTEITVIFQNNYDQLRSS